jgi:Regulator of ribonuclease activity B
MGLRDFLTALLGRSRSASRLEVVGEGEGTHDPDQQVLSQLRAAGADLGKPTHALFYIYASTQEGANRIATAVADSQLQAEVRPSAVGGGWLCLAQGQLVPTLEVVKRYRSQFEALAAAEGGEYDGWEAAVAK